MGGGHGASGVPADLRGGLVGRDSLLAELVDEVKRGTNLLLRGTPGVGKSALANALSEQADAYERHVDKVIASPAASQIALAALAPLGRPTGRSADDLLSMLDWYFGRWQSRRHDGVPALVSVDDVHHLDDVSAALLRRAVDRGCIQLVGTARRQETLPADLVSMLTSGELHAVPVPPLDDVASAELVRAWAPRPLESRETDRIIRLAQGHPLFLRELALASASSSTWHEGAAEAVIRRRLDDLTPPERRAAELVALAEPAPPGLLRHRDEAVRSLVRRGLLVTRDDQPSLRLEHPLYGEWLRDQLGPMVHELYDELAEHCDEVETDPVVRIDWYVRAGRRPDPDEAAAAVRLALARTDATTARRFLAHVGDERDLLTGQVMVIEGDLEGGLTLLEAVRTADPEPRRRVEAAATMAKHVGLSLGEFGRAHAILDGTVVPDVHEGLRDQLLNARLWLCIFGPTDVAGVPAPDELLHVREGTSDQLAFDLMTAAASVTFQTRGAEASSPLVERMLSLERCLEIDSAAYCRARTVEAMHLYGMDGLHAGIRVLAAAERLARQRGWLEGLNLLAGNLAWALALTGQVQRAAEVGESALRGSVVGRGPLLVDLYSYSTILRTIHRANRALAGAGPPDPDPVAAPAAHAPDDVTLFQQARQDVLEADLQVRRPPPLIETFETLENHGTLNYLEALYLDICDLRTEPEIHACVGRALTGAFMLRFPAGRRAAEARRSGDAGALYECGATLVEAGFVTAASRAFADVTRLVEESDALHLRARRGLAWLQTRWDGAPMPWLRDVAGLPTPRQMEITLRVARGESTRDLARELVLSPRTVENHLFRACHLLGCSGRDDLAWLAR